MLGKLLPVHPGFILLSLLPFVTCDDILFHDVDFGTSFSEISNLKEKCLDYPDLPFCHELKRFQEESDVQEDQDTKPTDNVVNLEENKYDVIEIPYISHEKPTEKRFNVFRRRNPNGPGYKRGPGFRSWGGKRDSINLIPTEKNKDFSLPDKSNKDKEKKIQGKSIQFYGWGGKREVRYPLWYDQVEKYPFWSSKSYLHKPYKKQAPRRQQFQSWGGKRLTLEPNPLQYYRYPSTVLDLKNLLTGEESRINLMAARDKRDIETEKRDKIALKARPIFQSWGGKRNGKEPEELDDMFTISEGKDKRGLLGQEFNSWGGKRDGKFMR